MKKIASILLLGLLCPIFLFGQGETSNWYFGNQAGIRFNNDGTVTAVEDSRINTFEGCATISNTFGELLFYTDGITVYDRNHDPMENGGGLYGDPSSTQSAIIVPKPEDPNIFYIFTVDTAVGEGDPDRGLNYSVVDISLNDGNGSVTQKNINLLTDCSEKIAAVVKDCFDKSIWVVTLASSNGTLPIFDTYHAFEVNTSGIVTSSVKSTLGNIKIEDPRGYLKLSPDGKKLASANASFGLYIYDFNAETGQVTNQEQIVIPGDNKNPYGVEFSPNSRFLYVHTSNDLQTISGHSSTLLQYDLQAPDINASAVVLDNGDAYRGALQQGENGKIYRTIAKNYTEGTPFLGVVNNPNVKGIEADYQHEAIDLAGKRGTQGLPPFVQSFFDKTDLVVNEDGTTSSTLIQCMGDSFRLEAADIPDATYSWEKDGVPLDVPNNNVFIVSSSEIGDSGRYRVEITLPDPDKCPIIGESLIRILPTPDPSISINQCDLDSNPSDGIAQFDLEILNDDPDIVFSYYENTGDRDNDIPISDTQQYRNTQPFDQLIYYKAENVLGCTSFGEIALEVSPDVVAPSSFGPFQYCDETPEDDVLESSFDLTSIVQNYTGLEVALYGSLEDAAVQQNELEGTLITGSTIIYARLQDGKDCLGVDAVELIVNPSPVIEMQNNFLLCTDNPQLTITAPQGFDTYRWTLTNENSVDEISQDAVVEITKPGNYTLETGYLYTVDGETIICSSSSDFIVQPSNKAIIQNIEINDFSNDNTVQIEVSGDGDYEFSLDGLNYQESNLFNNLEPGFRTLHVRDTNGCGVTQKEISVMGYPKYFTPNGDGVNDFWQITGITSEIGSNMSIAIYDRYGTLVTQISPEGLGWNGMMNSQLLPASDYWFRISLANGREIKGHFALKR